MPVDTVTRLMRPAGPTPAEPGPAGDTPAIDHTLVMEDAVALDAVEYRGRHRATTHRRREPEPWNPDPAWFPEEKTRDLNATFEPGVVAVPLPQREPSAPAGKPASVRVSGPLAVLMRAKQWIRGGEGGSR